VQHGGGAQPLWAAVLVHRTVREQRSEIVVELDDDLGELGQREQQRVIEPCQTSAHEHHGPGLPSSCAALQPPPPDEEVNDAEVANASRTRPSACRRRTSPASRA
jgi:hypothetical protein